MEINPADHEHGQVAPDLVITMFDVAQEWQRVQYRLLAFARALMQANSATTAWREAFATCLRESTAERADIFWEPCPSSSFPDDAQLVAVSFPPRRYGILVLAHDYLATPLLPTISQDFARICGLVLALVEYVVLVQHQLSQIPELSYEAESLALTRRERQVLLGLAHGESEAQIATDLGIQQSTVHTHRTRLYQCLDVHTSQEAVLRAFDLQLMNWLDLPLPTE